MQLKHKLYFILLLLIFSCGFEKEGFNEKEAYNLLNEHFLKDIMSETGKKPLIYEFQLNSSNFNLEHENRNEKTEILEIELSDAPVSPPPSIYSATKWSKNS